MRCDNVVVGSTRVQARDVKVGSVFVQMVTLSHPWVACLVDFDVIGHIHVWGVDNRQGCSDYRGSDASRNYSCSRVLRS